MREKKMRGSIVTRVSVTNLGIFMATCLLSLMVMTAVSGWFFYKKNVQVLEGSTSNVLYAADNMLKDMGRVSLISFSDEGVQRMLSEGGNDTFSEQQVNNKYLNELYASMISIRNDVRGIYIFNRDGSRLEFYLDHANPGRRKYVNSSSFFLEVKDAVERSGSLSGTYFYTAKLPSCLQFTEIYRKNVYQNNSIYFVRPIRTFSPYEIVGYIALRTPVAVVKNIAEEFVEPGVSYEMVDKDGAVVCGERTDEIGNPVSWETKKLLEEFTGAKGHVVGEYEGKRCLISYRISSYSNMLVLTAKPLQSIWNEMQPMLFYYMGISLCMAAIMFWVVHALTARNLRHLTEFARDMRNFQPVNLNHHYEIQTEDEIGQLKKSYNYMVDMINELVITEYQGRMQLQQAELSEQRMAMMYLKNQVNPHFLYNTLDMIRIKAALNEDDEVSQMLMMLVRFYRLSTRVDSSVVLLKRETEMLDSYMKLMCYRYPHLHYEAKIEEDILECPIPNFVLQPIVENALLHGLKDLNYEGTVSLRIKRAEENTKKTEIIICDDGVGMSPEMLESINTYLNERGKHGDRNLALAEDLNSNGIHIGIGNVWRRLEFFYGTGSSMRFENRSPRGLLVHIVVCDDVQQNLTEKERKSDEKN